MGANAELMQKLRRQLHRMGEITTLGDSLDRAAAVRSAPISAELPAGKVRQRCLEFEENQAFITPPPRGSGDERTSRNAADVVGLRLAWRSRSEPDVAMRAAGHSCGSGCGAPGCSCPAKALVSPLPQTWDDANKCTACYNLSDGECEMLDCSRLTPSPFRDTTDHVLATASTEVPLGSDYEERPAPLSPMQTLDSADVDRPTSSYTIQPVEAFPDSAHQGDQSGDSAGTRWEEPCISVISEVSEQPTASGSTEASSSFLEDQPVASAVVLASQHIREKPTESEDTTASHTDNQADLELTTLEASKEHGAERSVEEERCRAKERDAAKYRSLRPGAEAALAAKAAAAAAALEADQITSQIAEKYVQQLSAAATPCRQKLQVRRARAEARHWELRQRCKAIDTAVCSSEDDILATPVCRAAAARIELLMLRAQREKQEARLRAVYKRTSPRSARSSPKSTRKVDRRPAHEPVVSGLTKGSLMTPVVPATRAEEQMLRLEADLLAEHQRCREREGEQRALAREVEVLRREVEAHKAARSVRVSPL
mmetsp:Transcript_45517/g.90164  ORF Transcript_45517/g.90164 Transcript_45517/m.90164 type:complete len:543 (+) Transcript_45517:48-1676(+)